MIGDAKRHGVDLLPPDIHRSESHYTVEHGERKQALRMGLSAVKGMGEQAWQRIEAARSARPFESFGGFYRRTRLPRDLIANLIRAGALDAFGGQRTLLWQLGGSDCWPDEFDLETPVLDVTLPELEPLEKTVWEYELLGVSPDGQVMHHYRDALRDAGVLSTWQVKHECKAGQRVRVAGMVVVRQQPGTAKGMTFLSLEDESGLLDVVIRPDAYAKLWQTLRSQPLVVADGVVQRAARTVSVLLYGLHPLVGSV